MRRPGPLDSGEHLSDNKQLDKTQQGVKTKWSLHIHVYYILLYEQLSASNPQTPKRKKSSDFSILKQIKVSDSLAPAPNDDNLHEDGVKCLQEEWAKDKPERKTLKQLMNDTYEGFFISFMLFGSTCTCKLKFTVIHVAGNGLQKMDLVYQRSYKSILLLLNINT